MPETPENEPMKTFEILVKAYTTLAVEAEDAEAALELAGDIVREPSGWEIDGWEVENELGNEETIKAVIRHSPWHQYEGESDPFR